ncbi:unnamed protein product [Prorocentrum cordatum]|uniref:Uncharacterized protein n=1 Tax=Prorocentrum cordatum TaxID=2364126 RepID=A0ABN9W248_9DINO|nr:unnamed protein product [Polarella glacialis]CAK0880100.1 unnamed protein product [Polarella glacialis]
MAPRKATSRKMEDVKFVSERISGSLPLAESQGNKKLVVGESRAVARSAKVAEEIFDLSKKLGVTIIVADSPGLFDHDACPVQVFMRRIEFARVELEKDSVNYRLKDGRENRAKNIKKSIKKTKRLKDKLSPKMITTSGDAKVSGRKSTLEKAGELKPNQKVAIKKIMKEHGAGKIGLRTAAAQLSSALEFTVGGQETARRFFAEFKLCH